MGSRVKRIDPFGARTIRRTKTPSRKIVGPPVTGCFSVLGREVGVAAMVGGAVAGMTVGCGVGGD